MVKPPSGTFARTWQRFPLRSEQSWLNFLLLAIPAAIALEVMHAPSVWRFIVAAIGIIPLAGILGEATEVLAEHAGATVGGLLNATMGNATELIIAIIALRAGHIQVVKASLSGSIIGNLLLVLGLSVLVGGLGRQRQTFSRTAAGTNSTMLFLAVVALIMPAVFDLAVFGNLRPNGEVIERISLWTSGVLIVIYAISFIFVLKTHATLFSGEDVAGKPHPPRGSAGKARESARSWKAALVSLALATVAIGWLSELLVREIEAVTRSLGMTELFVGVIVVAIIGNAAEHSTAIVMARQNKMDLAMGIAIGSSTQIALFVAPLLVFVSLAMGKPMTLVFNIFEIVAIALSVFAVDMICSDGETNWFEGAQLLAIYVMLAVAFYFVPA